MKCEHHAQKTSFFLFAMCYVPRCTATGRQRSGCAQRQQLPPPRRRPGWRPPRPTDRPAQRRRCWPGAPRYRPSTSRTGRIRDGWANASAGGQTHHGRANASAARNGRVDTPAVFVHAVSKPRPFSWRLCILWILTGPHPALILALVRPSSGPPSSGHHSVKRTCCPSSA